MGSSTDHFEPEIVVLYCQNCTQMDLALADSTRRIKETLTRFVVMPCSSKVKVRQLLAILDQGADGIQIVKCPDGDCRFLDGKIKAANRVEHAHGLLKEIGFETRRVRIETGTELTEKDLFEMAAVYGSDLRRLGPNPLKKEKLQGQAI